MTKLGKIISAVVLVVVFLAAGFYFFWPQAELTKEEPPEISFGPVSSLFKGYLAPGSGGLLEFTEDDVDDWERPSGNSTIMQKNTHFYYTDEDVSIEEIIESIEPEEGNELLILYYSPGDEDVGLRRETNDGFYSYPDISDYVDEDSETDVYGIDDDEIEDFEIPAYRAFMIIAKDSSKLWNFYSEEDLADYDDDFLDDLEEIEGWVLIPAPEDFDDLSFLDGHEDMLATVWVQEDENEFDKASNITEGDLEDDYAMVWLKFGEPQAGTAPTITGLSVTPLDFNPTNLEQADVVFTTDEDAYVTVKILDTSGTLVDTFTDFTGSRLYVPSNFRVSWDGKDSSNTVVTAGTYTVSVEAENSAGTDVETAIVTVTTTENTPQISSLVATPATFDPANSESTIISFDLDRHAYVTLTIKNSTGTVIRTFPCINQGDTCYDGTILQHPSNPPAIAHTIPWDGKNDAGTAVTAGTYTIAALAETASGLSYSTTATVAVSSAAVTCTTNADCDDDLYCTGIETCSPAGECVAGTNPCLATPNTTCNEVTSSCDPTGTPVEPRVSCPASGEKLAVDGEIEIDLTPFGAGTYSYVGTGATAVAIKEKGISTNANKASGTVSIDGTTLTVPYSSLSAIKQYAVIIPEGSIKKGTTAIDLGGTGWTSSNFTVSLNRGNACEGGGIVEPNLSLLCPDPTKNENAMREGPGSAKVDFSGLGAGTYTYAGSGATAVTINKNGVTTNADKAIAGIAFSADKLVVPYDGLEGFVQYVITVPEGSVKKNGTVLDLGGSGWTSGNFTASQRFNVNICGGSSTPECEKDADCETGEVCNLTTHTCVTPTDEPMVSCPDLSGSLTNQEKALKGGLGYVKVDFAALGSGPYTYVGTGTNAVGIYMDGNTSKPNKVAGTIVFEGTKLIIPYTDLVGGTRYKVVIPPASITGATLAATWKSPEFWAQKVGKVNACGAEAYECTEDPDCPNGQVCNLTTHTCEEEVVPGDLTMTCPAQREFAMKLGPGYVRVDFAEYGSGPFVYAGSGATAVGVYEGGNTANPNMINPAATVRFASTELLVPYDGLANFKKYNVVIPNGAVTGVDLGASGWKSPNFSTQKFGNAVNVCGWETPGPPEGTPVITCPAATQKLVPGSDSGAIKVDLSDIAATGTFTYTPGSLKKITLRKIKNNGGLEATSKVDDAIGITFVGSNMFVPYKGLEQGSYKLVISEGVLYHNGVEVDIETNEWRSVDLPVAATLAEATTCIGGGPSEIPSEALSIACPAAGEKLAILDAAHANLTSSGNIAIDLSVLGSGTFTIDPTKEAYLTKNGAPTNPNKVSWDAEIHNTLLGFSYKLLEADIGSSFAVTLPKGLVKLNGVDVAVWQSDPIVAAADGNRCGITLTECQSNPDCPSDGVACNGVEVCRNKVCEHSGNPCDPGQTCEEAPAPEYYTCSGGGTEIPSTALEIGCPDAGEKLAILDAAHANLTSSGNIAIDLSVLGGSGTFTIDPSKEAYLTKNGSPTKPNKVSWDPEIHNTLLGFSYKLLESDIGDQFAVTLPKGLVKRNGVDVAVWQSDPIVAAADGKRCGITLTECQSNPDCPADGLACNGVEVCRNNVCEHRGEPCDPGETCTEVPGGTPPYTCSGGGISGAPLFLCPDIANNEELFVGPQGGNAANIRLDLSDYGTGSFTYHKNTQSGKVPYLTKNGGTGTNYMVESRLHSNSLYLKYKFTDPQQAVTSNYKLTLPEGLIKLNGQPLAGWQSAALGVALAGNQCESQGGTINYTIECPTDGKIVPGKSLIGPKGKIKIRFSDYAATGLELAANPAITLTGGGGHSAEIDPYFGSLPHDDDLLYIKYNDLNAGTTYTLSIAEASILNNGSPIGSEAIEVEFVADASADDCQAL